jgi:hypothetical protein
MSCLSLQVFCANLLVRSGFLMPKVEARTLATSAATCACHKQPKNTCYVSCSLLCTALLPAAAIATAAAQYDLTPGYGYPNAVMEDFSSKGRTPIFFDAQGNRFPVPQLYNKPDVTGPDGLVSVLCRLHLSASDGGQ